MTEESVAALLQPESIRTRCQQIFELAQQDRLQHFALHLERADSAVELVCEVTRSSYPSLKIPYHSRWRHFGERRSERWEKAMAKLPAEDRLRARFDLTIISVLLDAGAGAQWTYRDPLTNEKVGRSEGLGLASFDMFTAGKFGQGDPIATAEGLESLTDEQLAEGFQAGPQNPLVGIRGRRELLVRLAQCLKSQPEVFPETRPAGLADVLLKTAKDRKIDAGDILHTILTKLGTIWPSRIVLDNIPLGDTWQHSQVTGPGLSKGLIPFHKLSQWLTYSLIEALEVEGTTVGRMDRLTGLAEYRNGGLLIDSGVLSAKDPNTLKNAIAPDSEVIVEWRALTVALLDLVAKGVRRELGCTEEELPLARILEGGTWSAGRSLAFQLRGGKPPIAIVSDGTVF